MLQTIRSKTHGVFAWIVIIVIGFVFAVWGIEGYLSAGSDQVAVVNGETISGQELQRTVEQLGRQQQMMQAMQGVEQPANELVLRQQALGALISEKMLATSAQKAGFVVGKDQVDDLLVMLPQFQENGVFSADRFETILSTMGYTPAVFRQAIQNDLMIGQVRGSIVDSAFVLPYELDAAINLLEQTRDIEYLLIPAFGYLSQANVSEQEIADFYATHPADFMLPERVSLQYMLINADDFVIETPDEQTLQDYYEANKAQYTDPEQRKAEHILLTVEAEGDEQDLNARAEKILQELQAGADFAALAKQYSADPGSAGNGGDLGWFGRGMMVPEFDEAVFTANAGDITGPVKTDFGLHIIKVVEIKPESVKPFAEIKDEIQAAWLENQRVEQFESTVAQLDTLAFENPDELNVASSELNLPLATTVMFSREQTQPLGELDYPSIVDAAFSDSVLLDGRNSDLIYLNPTQVMVLRKLDYAQPALEPIDVVHDAIKQRLALEKAAEIARENANAWLAELKQGAATAAINTAGLNWHSETQTNRYNFAVPPEVLNRAFSLPNPDQAGVVADVIAVGQEDYALVVVKGVHAGKLDETFAMEMRGEYAKSLSTFKGELDYQLYAIDAQKKSSIDVTME